MTRASAKTASANSEASPSPPGPAGDERPVVVTGVLVVHDGEPWLKACLDALSLQSRPLDRLMMVDTGSVDESASVAATHSKIREVVDDVCLISLPRGTTFGAAVGRAVEQQSLREMALGSASPQVATSAEWLWLLHDDSAADPQALAHLLDAAIRTPTAGIAGPKLTIWDDPSRLLEVGSVTTRAGRRVEPPAAGEPDQGQHDLRSDVLGVSTSGMLVRRDVFDTLGGFDPAFGQARGDLDLCWRAYLAGHRVVVAPKARVREAAASTHGERSPELSATDVRRTDRRLGREVALARCSPYAVPFLALWIAVAGLTSTAVLLVTKRPQQARTALGDLESLMTFWRPLAARWRWRVRVRSLGIRPVANRELQGLFAPPSAGFGQSLDTIQNAQDSGSTRSQGSGPRVLRSPGFLAVAVGVLLAGATWRSLLGPLISSMGSGLVGGELRPATSSASELWHSWVDGWHGAGLGSALQSAPHLPFLSAGAWVLEHLPLVDTTTSSVGVFIAWLLLAAIPASAGTAYLGARVVTPAAWPRAWAALAWASLATLTTAAAGGRVGAVVAHLLLPLVAAGLVGVARGTAGPWTTLGTAAALGVAGAFNPVLAALGAAAALVLLAVGRGRTRLSAGVLVLVPIGVLGPWILRLVDDPVLLLTGPGLTVWEGAAASPWQLALLHPGGAGSYPALLSAPIVLAGVVALSRRDLDPPALTVLTGLTLTGLVLGVAAPRIVIGVTPQGMVGAGSPITAWAGTGLDLAALALIAAALLGLPGLRAEFWRGFPKSGFGWRHILVACVVSAAVLGVAASAGMAGWLGAGGTLNSQAPSTPAVVEDQTNGPMGGRTLVMTRDADTIGYRLVGREPGPLIRDLPAAGVDGAVADPQLAAAVRSMVSRGDASSAGSVQNSLADLGVGFVDFRGPPTDPLVNQLDATVGLNRLGDAPGHALWRVPARGSSLSPSRLRLVDVKGAPLASVAVSGDHGRTDVAIGSAGPGPPPVARRLVVAQPSGWAEHARVTYAGRELAAMAGAQQPTYQLPPEAGQLRITVAPGYPWWRWGQIALLLVALILVARPGWRPGRRSGRAR